MRCPRYRQDGNGAGGCTDAASDARARAFTVVYICRDQWHETGVAHAGIYRTLVCNQWRSTSFASARCAHETLLALSRASASGSSTDRGLDGRARPVCDFAPGCDLQHVPLAGYAWESTHGSGCRKYDGPAGADAAAQGGQSTWHDSHTFYALHEPAALRHCASTSQCRRVGKQVF